MKKRNLNSKKMRVLSVGLLTSTAVLSVNDVQPIVAKESEDHVTAGSEEQEDVAILSSTSEYEPTESTVEGIATSSSTQESSSESTDETVEESTTDSSTTDETSSSSTQETTDSTSTTDSSTSDSTSSSDSSTSSTGSTSSTSSSTGTTSSTTTPSKPKPKPKPQPSKPKPAPKPSTPAPTPVQPQQPIQGPQQPITTPPTNNVSIGSTTSGASPAGSDQVFHISPNLTTKSFVEVIGEDARQIAGENNVYASVMIAQAILESASGNSALASAPNYNLFGIKGSYKGQSANFLTSEDDGSGSMFTIRSDFRKYPSYKESLEDYVKLIRGGTDFNNSFYSGTWKTNTKSYKDATKFLTGRYATDTSYNAKLNGLIDAYNLTQYDTLKDNKKTKKAKKISLNTSFDKLEKQNDKADQNIEYITHIVEKGESLKSISELYNISTLAILDKNQLDRRMLFIGQKLSIPKQEEKTTVVVKEDAVDRSLDMVQKLSTAFAGKETTQSSEKQVAKSTKTTTTKETTTKETTDTSAKKDAKDYQVSATRKKTKETYEVKKGDTLASISKKTGVSVWSLKEWNDLDQYFLTEGQQLILTPIYDLQS